MVKKFISFDKINLNLELDKHERKNSIKVYVLTNLNLENCSLFSNFELFIFQELGEINFKFF